MTNELSSFDEFNGISSCLDNTIIFDKNNRHLINKMIAPYQIHMLPKLINIRYKNIGSINVTNAQYQILMLPKLLNIR
jgi:hypothetical protein